MPSVLDRLADCLRVDDGCWGWDGPKLKAGYGNLTVDRRTRLLHRMVYELLVGPIPEGLVLDHLCENPECSRPDHLQATTQKVNVTRGARSNAQKTECLHGHPLSGDNLYVWRGKRKCRLCKRLTNQRTYHRRMARRQCP